MTNAIRFVTSTVLKITDLVENNKMTEEVAIELINTMKDNGFADNHEKFFETVKKLIHKIATKQYED